jgi:nucleoside-diphosphate-sugar epimerase
MPQKEKIKRIAVTGMCGEWGKILADALAKKTPFECVLGLDIKEPSHTFPNFHFHKIFLTDKKNLISALKKYNIEAVVHLAFHITPQTKISDVISVNVEAASNVAEAAASLGLKKFILGSSTTVYGAFPRGNLAVTEDTPPRPNKDYSFAVLKTAVENAVLDALYDTDISLMILRRAQLLSPYSKTIFPFRLRQL